jgi:hypothetical protein
MLERWFCKCWLPAEVNRWSWAPSPSIPRIRCDLRYQQLFRTTRSSDVTNLLTTFQVICAQHLGCEPDSTLRHHAIRVVLSACDDRALLIGSSILLTSGIALWHHRHSPAPSGSSTACVCNLERLEIFVESVYNHKTRWIDSHLPSQTTHSIN